MDDEIDIEDYETCVVHEVAYLRASGCFDCKTSDISTVPMAGGTPAAFEALVKATVIIRDVPAARAFPGVDRRVSIEVKYGDVEPRDGSYTCVDNPTGDSVSSAIGQIMRGYVKGALR